MQKDTDMNASAAMQQYRQNHVQGGVDTASPHRLVQMLMEGALEKILTAKSYMENKEIAKREKRLAGLFQLLMVCVAA